MFGYIEKECNCVLKEEAIDQDHLLCDQSQSNNTVFRAKLATNQLTHEHLLMIIQSLVTGGRLTLNDSTVLRLDSSCPVKISTFNDPLCTSSAITNNVEDEMQSNKSPPIAEIVGIVVAIIVTVVLLVFVLLLVLYWRTKHRYIANLQCMLHKNLL